jgi:hypothetical protein
MDMTADAPENQGEAAPTSEGDDVGDDSISFDSDLNVPIEIRSHEQQQLESMVPDVIESLERAELDTETIEQAHEKLRDPTETFTAPDQSFYRYLSLPVDSWQTLIQELERVQGKEGHATNRVHYLRRKLFKRVRDRMEELQ